jgi:hypothetical protein
LNSYEERTEICLYCCLITIIMTLNMGDISNNDITYK